MNECKPDGFWNQDMDFILCFCNCWRDILWIERLRVYDYAFIFRCFRIQPHVDANYRVD